MIKKFYIRLDSPRAEIKEVEVDSETKTRVYKTTIEHNGVIVRGSQLKKAQDHEYHDTWDDAYKALAENAQYKVELARRMLELAHAFQGNVRGLLKQKCKQLVKEAECENPALKQL